MNNLKNAALLFVFLFLTNGVWAQTKDSPKEKPNPLLEQVIDQLKPFGSLLAQTVNDFDTVQSCKGEQTCDQLKQAKLAAEGFDYGYKTVTAQYGKLKTFIADAKEASEEQKKEALDIIRAAETELKLMEGEVSVKYAVISALVAKECK